MMPPAQSSKPTPKRLILSLLSAPSLEIVEVGHLVQWGRLFDIDPAAIRVAVGRLTRQGLLQGVTRGSYCIGPQGHSIARAASNWIHAEDRIGPWSGEWIMVHSAHLGRSNRTALRSRERAFRLSGFAELAGGLWSRPANFTTPTPAIRDNLVALGLEPAAIVMQVTAIPGVSASTLSRLWPRQRLEAGYQQQCALMRASEAGLSGMSVAAAARETFLVGEAVIRTINADPLLPDTLIDAGARREMIEQMKHYNQLGRAAWENFQLRDSAA